MEYCKCSKEGEIATLLSEMANLKENQTETRDLVIVVTKLVEQFGTTQRDVMIIKQDIQVLKEKPFSVVSKIVYMILGVVVTILVNRVMGVI